ncbi:PP2C family protein-serine/threonine phosphatase [Cellulosimicrobium cellulans]|uniref:PP2C family protein-serine/threonine phosphatase n=1 Tax=Cellulosimicrobium cellulans TaxID=1710 RepID=UPI0037F6A25C
MDEHTTGLRPLVSEIVNQLAQTSDVDEAVRRLARLLVPEAADWCIVTLVADDESRTPHRHLSDIGWWHADPARRATLAEYAAVRISALREHSMLMDSIDSLRLVHVPTDALDALDEVLVPGRARDLAEQLAPTSLTVVPLHSRGRTLGALTLFMGEGRAALTPADLAVLSPLSDAAALALDNARLYRQQRNVALTFQRSLLTAPVEPDHMHVAARYQPAAEATRVGGDWYDAFMQPDGSTVLVIGDVVGHNIEAAALMAQLRSMLRAVSVVTQGSPAEVVEHLDAAVRTLQIPVMATLVVARIEQTREERVRGITRMRWTNAGHLPPMVINPDGTVLALPAPPNDPLLGLMPDRRRTDHEITLDRESTVVLYTDGLIERRTRSVNDGLTELHDALTRHAELPADDLTDALLAELPAGPGEDDIALIAVRLHRQDRPRPDEAGPTQVPPDVPGAPTGS